jgi:hypothetical protein
MAGYFAGCPRTLDFQPAVRHSNTRNISTVPLGTVALFERFRLFDEDLLLALSFG